MKGNEIEGEIDVFVSENELFIHGDPDGLKSFAKLLIEIAEFDQEKTEDNYLPKGARVHYHLRPGIELSKSSNEVIVGRLDAKNTGNFYERFISKNK